MESSAEYEYGSPVTNYIVKSCDDVMAPVESPIHRIKIDRGDLEPDTGYKIVVIMENSIGKSPPSDPIKISFADPEFDYSEEFRFNEYPKKPIDDPVRSYMHLVSQAKIFLFLGS